MKTPKRSGVIVVSLIALPILFAIARILYMYFYAKNGCGSGLNAVECSFKREGAATGIGVTIFLTIILTPIYYSLLYGILVYTRKRGRQTEGE